MLLISIFSLDVILGVTGVNVELNGILSAVKRSVDFDTADTVAIAVEVLLLHVVVPKLGNDLVDVISVVVLPKV